MNTWELHVARGWLGAAEVRVSFARDPSTRVERWLDVAATVALARRAGTHDVDLETLFMALSTPAAGRVWDTHRGAVLALLEGWTEIAARAPGTNPQQFVDLLLAEATLPVRVGTGYSFSVGETLIALLASSTWGKEGSAIVQRVGGFAAAFAADLTAGRRWVSDLAAPLAWPDGSRVGRGRTSRAARRPLDAIPFGGLCPPDDPRVIDLAERFARRASADITLYDAAPLHVAACAALLAALGPGRDKAVEAALRGNLTGTPGRLFELMEDEPCQPC